MKLRKLADMSRLEHLDLAGVKMMHRHIHQYYKYLDEEDKKRALMIHEKLVEKLLAFGCNHYSPLVPEENKQVDASEGEVYVTKEIDSEGEDLIFEDVGEENET